MDYNKDDRGFVCAVYRLTCARAFYGVLLVVGLAFVFWLKFSSFDTNLSEQQTIAFYALCMMCVGFVLPLLAPRMFLPKLFGFLLALGSLAVALHHINLLASPLFYAGIIFGAFLLVMLLSWFVYNARSSEINEI